MKSLSPWVVDASVGIKLFLTEPYSAEATSFFRRFNPESREHLYIPDLFYAECANVFWKQVSRRGYSAFEAAKDITELRRMKLRVISSQTLVEDALRLALKWE